MVRSLILGRLKTSIIKSVTLRNKYTLHRFYDVQCVQVIAKALTTNPLLRTVMYSTHSIRTAYSYHLLAAHRGNFAPMPFVQFVRTVAFVVKGL
jgi:hypothetical protein